MEKKIEKKIEKKLHKKQQPIRKKQKPLETQIVQKREENIQELSLPEVTIDTHTDIAPTSWKKSIRKWIVFFSICILYCLWFTGLYIYTMSVFSSLLYMFGIYTLLHFFSIDYSNITLSRYVTFFSIITLIQWFCLSLFDKSDIHMYISLLVVNIGIILTIRMLYHEIESRISFNIFRYCGIGMYMFTIMITLGYALFILGSYKRFPYSCELLYEKSTYVIDILTTPLVLGVDHAQDIKGYVESFFDTTVQDLVNMTSGVTLYGPVAVSFIETGQTVSGLFIYHTDETNRIDTINQYKFTLVDQVVADSRSLNKGLCEYTMSIIEQKVMKSTFQLSVIVLTFFLLSPFVTFIMYIVSLAVYIVMYLLCRWGVYKRRVSQIIKEFVE